MERVERYMHVSDYPWIHSSQAPPRRRTRCIMRLGTPSRRLFGTEAMDQFHGICGTAPSHCVPTRTRRVMELQWRRGDTAFGCKQGSSTKLVPLLRVAASRLDWHYPEVMAYGGTPATPPGASELQLPRLDSSTAPVRIDAGYIYIYIYQT